MGKLLELGIKYAGNKRKKGGMGAVFLRLVLSLENY